ncbi:MAG: hypothetical protein AB1511_07205 [Deinococcota bacterium]
MYRQLRQAFGPDAFDLAGRGPGWTFPSLELRINHVMTRGLTPTWAVTPGRCQLSSSRLTLFLKQR